jgi:K+-transporting ATPase KdpF subunit
LSWVAKGCSAMNIILGIIGMLLLGYLLVSLIRPEKF